MKESYIQARLKHLNAIEQRFRLANMLRYGLKTIGVPEGLQEPDLYMYTSGDPTISLWLHYWPMEAACGFVAEIEMLLDTLAEVKVASDSKTIDHIFFKDSPFEFRVYVSPSNCTWEGDPGMFEYREPKLRPKC